jgi:dTMP kinase
VLIDATAEPGIVAANIWSALRDRFFATGAGNLASSA